MVKKCKLNENNELQLDENEAKARNWTAWQGIVLVEDEELPCDEDGFQTSGQWDERLDASFTLSLIVCLEVRQRNDYLHLLSHSSDHWTQQNVNRTLKTFYFSILLSSSLTALEVFQQYVHGLALFTVVLDDNARAGNDLAGASFTVNLAETGPFAQLLGVAHLLFTTRLRYEKPKEDEHSPMNAGDWYTGISYLNEVDVVLGAKSLNKLDVLLFGTGLNEDGHVGLATINHDE
jgi:hypothetical protein